MSLDFFTPGDWQSNGVHAKKRSLCSKKVEQSIRKHFVLSTRARATEIGLHYSLQNIIEYDDYTRQDIRKWKSSKYTPAKYTNLVVTCARRVHFSPSIYCFDKRENFLQLRERSTRKRERTFYWPKYLPSKTRSETFLSPLVHPSSSNLLLVGTNSNPYTRRAERFLNFFDENRAKEQFFEQTRCPKIIELAGLTKLTNSLAPIETGTWIRVDTNTANYCKHFENDPHVNYKLDYRGSGVRTSVFTVYEAENLSARVSINQSIVSPSSVPRSNYGTKSAA